jgi:hypothetical protein
MVGATTPVTLGAGAPGVTQAFTATATANGTYSAVFTPTTFGVYNLTATGVETFTTNMPTDAMVTGNPTTLVTTTEFTVTPGVSAVTTTTSAVYPCTPFTVTATSGFSPTDIVSLTPAGGSAVTATVNSTGGFVATNLIAPSGTPVGNLNVTINSHFGVFTVTQPITVPTASLLATPNMVSVGGSTVVSGSGYIPNMPVNLATYFSGANGALVSAGGPTAVVTASATGGFTSSLTISPTIQTVNGAYVISGTSNCSTANTATTPVTVTTTSTTSVPTGPTNQPTTIYFAEGYTGRFATNGKADFDEFISVLNPDNFTKTVTFTYQLEPGSVAPITTTTTFVTQIGPNTDILRSVNGDVGNDQFVGAIVSSNGRIAAERIINRTSPSGPLDADSSLGNTMPGTTWYFAEGYTGASFQEYLTVMNPNTSPVSYTVTFLPPGTPAASPLQVSFTVPAMGRDTQNIRRLYLPFLPAGVAAAGGGQSIGMLVTSSAPIVAERVEYWGDGSGSAKFGASAKPGATAPQTQYIFAYGSNPGATPSGTLGPAQSANDESYITVINPGAAGGSDATVLVKFYDSTGTFIGSKSITVSPQTRETVVVNQVIPVLSGPYYAIVTSDLPVFAEKPNYVGGSPNSGSHPGFDPSGTPAGIQSVLFPNVNTGTASGTAIVETVFLVNTSAQPETIVGTYYTPGGATTQVAYTVNPGALRVVNVNADAGNLPVGPLGAQYTTGFGGQFVAARIASSPSGTSYVGNQGVYNQ